MKSSLRKSLILSCSFFMFLAFLIPVQAADIITTTSVSPCENCQSTTTPQLVKHSTTPGQFTLPDSGAITYSTSLNGFSFNDTGVDSLSLGLPSIGGVAQTASTIMFNSSLTLLSFSGINFYFKPQGYSTLESISGTVGSPTTISIPLSSSTVGATCDSLPHAGVDSITGQPITIPACTQANFGNLGYSWADAAAFSPSYNNATHVLTFTVSGTFLIDPLAIDGVAAKCSFVSGSSCNVSLTTSNTNDVIIINEFRLVLNTNACSAPTTAGGPTFTQRQQTTASGTVFDSCEYYAVWSGSGALTITCNWSVASSGSTYECLGFGVSGANTGTPFDSNANAKCNAGNGGAVTSISCNVSTNNANDMIIGLGSSNTIVTWTMGAGFTMVQASCTNTLACDQYQIVSATQTNLAVSMTDNSAGYMTILGDSIQQAAVLVTQPIIITTLPAGAPSATISISGCAVSNATFTADGFTHTYSSVTGSCTITLTEPTDGTHTRYRFNVSPKPTPASSITFTTCASGTCPTYSNSTYYQLNNNMSANPQNPTTWDGSFSWHRTDTFLGSSKTTNCASITSGGGVQGCLPTIKVWADYNTQSCLSTPIGNTWIAQAPNCFTHTTANNVDTVNYVQTTAGGGLNFNWLLLLPFGILIVVIVIGRKRL